MKEMEALPIGERFYYDLRGPQDPRSRLTDPLCSGRPEFDPPRRLCAGLCYRPDE